MNFQKRFFHEMMHYDIVLWSIMCNLIIISLVLAKLISASIKHSCHSKSQRAYTIYREVESWI